MWSTELAQTLFPRLLLEPLDMTPRAALLLPLSFPVPQSPVSALPWYLKIPTIGAKHLKVVPGAGLPPTTPQLGQVTQAKLLKGSS